MESKELGIYIHIPFCKQKCNYCDFVSFSNKQNLAEDYIHTIKTEINNYFDNKKILENYNVTTIYIGGGTPSYIDEKYILEILELIENKLKNNQTKFKDMEITIEVNPGTVNKEKLEQYRKAKINRLSIGLQSTKDNLLKEIGRIHTFEDFLEAYNLANQIGFDNINVDLMIGLPNQTIQDIKESLNQIIELKPIPTHISVYSLIIEEGTVIDKLIRENKLQEMDENLERNMYWYVKNTLELNGYKHYEISNFAKKGKESKHNLNCWRQKEYIGIGLAAHSYLSGVRYSNSREFSEYVFRMNRLDETIIEDILKISNNVLSNEIETNLKDKIEKVYRIEEVQTLEDKKKEYMLLGLRTIKGISISKFKEKYIDNPIFLYKKELEELVEEKLIIIDGDYIKLTNKGLDLANIVWEKFL